MEWLIFEIYEKRECKIWAIHLHRTNESRNNSNIQDWSYNRAELNVVDDCSWCVKFKDLSNNQWITQPSFLYQQTIEIEQNPIIGVRSIPIID